eukprot:289075-Chlamydomonas_euryale.AAC.4
MSTTSRRARSPLWTCSWTSRAARSGGRRVWGARGALWACGVGNGLGGVGGGAGGGVGGGLGVGGGGGFSVGVGGGLCVGVGGGAGGVGDAKGEDCGGGMLRHCIEHLSWRGLPWLRASFQRRIDCLGGRPGWRGSCRECVIGQGLVGSYC